MFNLLKKDLIISKYYFIIFLIYILFFNIINDSDISIYMLLSMFPILSTTMYDSYYKSSQISLSLPIKRKTLVLSKYLSTLFIAVINFILLVLINHIFSLLNFSHASNAFILTNINLFLLSFVFITSIILPLYFKGIPYMVMMIFIIIIPIISSITLIKLDLLNNLIFKNILIEKLTYNILFAFVLIIIYFSSFLLSFKIYKNKDF